MELTEAEVLAASDDSATEDSGDDDTIQQSEDGEPQAKKQRTSLRRPPTTDELISLRQTQNLFHSNLFQLQTTEMLAEVTPTAKHQRKLQAWLEELETWLRALPTRPAKPLHKQAWVHKSGLQVPIPSGLPEEDSESKFGFGPPQSVTRAGAAGLDVLERSGTVDLLLEMPLSCVEKADVTNARYARKRALYLTYLAWRVRGSALVTSAQFCRVDGEPLRPALLLTPSGAGVKHYRVRLLPVPPAGLIQPCRLSPVKSNVHSRWLRGQAVPPQKEQPTPHYNAGVLADVLARETTANCAEGLADSDAVKQALRMLRVWLRQRGLDRGPGAITVDMLSLFILWLFKQRRLSKLMSGYQVMRNVWVQLTKTDWAAEGVSFVENPSGDQPALQQFTGCFAVTLVEPSGYHNVTAGVSSATYARLRDEAGRAVSYLDDPEVDSFQALFMTPLPFAEAFDQLVHIGVSALTSSVSPDRDRPAGGLPAVLPRLLSVLQRGLTDRCLLLDVDRWPPLLWDAAAPPPAEETATLTLGLRLNPLRLTSVVDKGPDSEDRAAAAEFRQFWGGRAETRRFQDGSIREAVVWPASTLHQHRAVCGSIAGHLLQRQFGVSAADARWPCGGPELLLTQTRRLPAFPHGSGEEAQLALERTFARLSTSLRRLDGLPLSVAAVHAAAPALRHAEVFPPLPEMYGALSGRTVRHEASQLLERQAELPLPWAPACDVILQMEVSGKWPEEPAAIQRVRAAFHLQIRAELTGQGLTACVRRDGVLVISDGYLFRLWVACPREPALLRTRGQPTAAAQLERRTVQLPRLSSALAALQRQLPAYSAAVRLALRWLHAQMLSGLVPALAAELLMARVFVSPAPLVPPQQPAAALLRWLRLLANTDWSRQPLMVNLNDQLPAEKQAPLQAHFNTERQKLPAWVIYTPFDDTGRAWTHTHPTANVLHHAQKLAAAAHQLLTSQLTSPASEPDWRAAYRPPLQVFDVRLQLDRRRLPRRHQEVDCRGQPATADPYTKQPYEAVPPPDWDPAQKLVAELRQAASWALVCHDACGGDVIGVLVRPDALRARSLSAFAAEGHVPAAAAGAGGQVVASVAGFVDLARALGQGLVKDVHVEWDRLAQVES